MLYIYGHIPGLVFLHIQQKEALLRTIFGLSKQKMGGISYFEIMCLSINKL